MSDSDRTSPRDLAAAYALGALEAEEARAFEAELARSPELRREVAEYREVHALLATTAAAPAPQTGLRDRVVQHVAREKTVAFPASAAGRGSWVRWAALAAGVVAVVGLGSTVVSLRRQLAERDSALAALESTLAERESRLAAREATLNSILEPSVELTRLVSATNTAPIVQLFVNRKKHIAIVHAFNLTPATSGRAYQLWFIPKGGSPIPSVTFNSEENGHALVQQIQLPEGPNLTAAAITDEPASGSSAPTTPVLLVGNLGA